MKRKGLYRQNKIGLTKSYFSYQKVSRHVLAYVYATIGNNYKISNFINDRYILNYLPIYVWVPYNLS